MSPGACLLAAGFFFSIAHAAVKFLPALPTSEIVLFRALFQAVISFAWLRLKNIHPWGRNKPMLILRGIVGTLSLGLYVYTLQTMPLASAVTINYLAPIFTVLVSWAMLRERPQWYHWVLLGFSFAGVLLVRGFDTRITPLELAAGVGAALCASVAYSLVRKLRDEDHALVVVFYFPLVTIPLVLPFALSEWVTPVGRDWLALIVLGVFTQLAQYFMTLAYQGSPAARITNLNYVTVLYALAIGYFVFGETVEPEAFAGIAVIIASAIFAARVGRLSSAHSKSP